MAVRSIPARQEDAHKGTFGHALLVGGSRGMSGAISIAAMATMRSGAGLTTVATADTCLETVASFDPCMMTVALSDDDKGRISLNAKNQILELANKATCIALGPGLSQSPELIELVAQLYREIVKPMVVDADALNCLAKSGMNLQPGGPRVLTPHPGEFRRLVNDQQLQTTEMQSRATELAGKSDCILLLKGNRTFVTDGEQTYHNKTGNPGMATGGSGDVLTGVITALICQGFSPFEAACTGAHLHGMAGDFAAEQYGQVSLIARDIIESLPLAFKKKTDNPRRIGFPV